jgi:hypothetical protein
MRTFILFLIISSVVPQIYSADTVAPAELTRLRTSYEGASQRALAPIKQTYAKALQQLLEQFTKSGKLDEAVQVKAELKSLESQPTASGAPSTSSVDLTKNQTEKMLLASKWLYYEGGTAEDKPSSGPGDIVEFLRNGRATVKKTTGAIETTWKLTSDRDLVYRMSDPKWNCTLKRLSDGIFSGKCTGTSGDVLGYVHLIAQPKQ